MHLNQLSIERRVARGGMGAVYQATWKTPSGGVPVAVKFLHGTDTSPAPVAFYREARAAARLSHPNIVSLLDAGRVGPDAAHDDYDPGTPYLVMEWVEGTTLSQERPADWAALLSVLEQVLNALSHAHACDVLHRDLKPANVMIDRSGRARLTDFGIGRLVNDPRTSGRRVVGTAAYMAPEQIVGTWRDEGPWTDIYGLASAMWQMVTGETLYRGDDKSVIFSQVREPLPAFVPRFEVPEGFEGWLRGALAKDPRQRFSTAPQALGALHRLASNAATAVHQSLRPGGVRRAARLQIPAKPLSDDRPISSDLRSAGVGVFGLRVPPLVGRRDHKQELWDAFRRASKTEHGHVVLLHGAAGVGKSALANWLCRRVGEGDFATMLLSTHEPGVVGEAALSGAVSRQMRTQGLHAEPAIKRTAEYLRDIEFPDAQEAALEFAARTHPGSSTRRRLQQPTEWHRFLLDFARHCGGGRPVVWFMEDIHLSPATVDFVAAAARAEFPLLVVATCRPNGQHDPIAASVTLEVGPLGTHEMQRLVDAMLPLDRSLAESLIARAGGSPMFAKQLLDDWVQRDVLRPGPMGYRAVAEEVSRLPDNVHDVWRSRLAAVFAATHDDCAEALTLTAIMGEYVGREEWRRAADELGIEEPTARLEDLERAGLVSVDQHQLRTAHALLRESLLQDLVDANRFHRAAANALAVGSTPRLIERTARHLWAAGLHGDAFDRLYDAIIAYRTEDEHDVIIFLVPLMRDWAAESGRTKSVKLAHALTLLGAELMRRGGAALGRDVAEEAAAIVFSEGDLEHVIAEGDPLRCLAATSVMLGRAARMRARDVPACISIYADARRVAFAGGWRGKAAFAASHQALTLNTLGREKEAQEVLERSVAATTTDGLPLREVVLVLQQRGDLFALRGETADAIDTYSEALEHSNVIGDPDYIAYACERLGDLHLLRGNFAASRGYQSEAHASYQRRKAWNVPVLLLTMLTLDATEGTLAEVPPHFVQQFESEKLKKWRGLALAVAALTEAQRGELELAAELFTEARANANRVVQANMLIIAALLSCYRDCYLGILAAEFVHEQGSEVPAAVLEATRNGPAYAVASVQALD